MDSFGRGPLTSPSHPTGAAAAHRPPRWPEKPTGRRNPNSYSAESCCSKCGSGGRSRHAKSKYGVCLALRNNTQTEPTDRRARVAVAAAAVFSSRFVFTVSLSVASRMRHRRNVVGRPTGLGRG